jgi:hypothetical protein
MAVALAPWAFSANKEATFARRFDFSCRSPSLLDGHPFALRCTQACPINIMVPNRLSWYKRLIELPAGCADPSKLQGSGGMPTAGKQLEKICLILRA